MQRLFFIGCLIFYIKKNGYIVHKKTFKETNKISFGIFNIYPCITKGKRAKFETKDNVRSIYEPNMRQLQMLKGILTSFHTLYNYLYIQFQSNESNTKLKVIYVL